MQTIKDILDLGVGHTENDIWHDCVACVEVDRRQLGDGRQVSLQAFAFLLLTGGTLEAIYNGQQYVLHRGDMLIYAPTLAYQSVSMSDDYQGYFLVATESIVNLAAALQHLPSVAYFPVTVLGSPLLSLRDDRIDDTVTLFRRLRRYITEDVPLKQDAIAATLSLLIADLLEMQNQVVDSHHVSQRDEELFNAFLSLVATDYITYRDLRHYAYRLNITTTYLSRVVRQVSGHTVLDFIHQRLADDAVMRLKTTTRTVAQIADDLHFPDAATFSKFFKKMKGVPPKEFREVER